MKTAAASFALVAALVPAQAFVVPPMSMRTPSFLASSTIMDDEIDNDAPIERAVAVGNAVRRPNKLFGQELPSFLSFLGKPDEDGNAKQQIASMMDTMDEECYLGKEGTAEDCVDFDPMH